MIPNKEAYVYDHWHFIIIKQKKEQCLKKEIKKNEVHSDQRCLKKNKQLKETRNTQVYIMKNPKPELSPVQLAANYSPPL